MITFDPDPRRPVWIQVMEIIRERIQDGAYPPDSKIPSYKQITQEFGVGLNTARRVVDDLTEQGLVQPIQSMGTFVTSEGSQREQGDPE